MSASCFVIGEIEALDRRDPHVAFGTPMRTPRSRDTITRGHLRSRSALRWSSRYSGNSRRGPRGARGTSPGYTPACRCRPGEGFDGGLKGSVGRGHGDLLSKKGHQTAPWRAGSSRGEGRSFRSCGEIPRWPLVGRQPSRAMRETSGVERATGLCRYPLARGCRARTTFSPVQDTDRPADPRGRRLRPRRRGCRRCRHRRLRRAKRQSETRLRVSQIAEGSHRVAVAFDRDVPAGDDVANEIGEHPAVRQVHPGP